MIGSAFFTRTDGSKFIGLCKTNETKNLQKKQALAARPPPNKLEGATVYSIKNTKLNKDLFVKEVAHRHPLASIIVKS